MGPPLRQGSIKIVDPDLNSQDDGCDPAKFAAAGPFNGTVAVVDQGNYCSLYDKARNAFANGALGLIMFAAQGVPLEYNDQIVEGIQFASMRREEGLSLKSAIVNGANVTADFSRQNLTDISKPENGGLMNGFSTISTFWDMTGGPRVSGVGGGVLSAFPINLGQYAVESGTSQATPQIAGIAALYLSIHGGKSAIDPLKLRDIFSSTATPVNVNSDKAEDAALLDTVVKQGGGLVNAYKVLYHTTEVSPGFISLNDTAHAALNQTITITNVGKQAQTYQVSHEPAGSLMTLNPDTNFWRGYSLSYDAVAASVAIAPDTLALQPGETGSVRLAFAAPSGIDATQIPIYSGFVNFTSSSEPDLGSVRVPYFGIVADMGSQDGFLLEPNAEGIAYPTLGDAYGSPVYNDSATFTLKPLSDGTVDAPTFLARLRLGSARISVDLVDANTTYKPTIPILDPNSPQTQRRDLLFRKHRRGSHSDGASSGQHNAKRGGAGTYDQVDTIGNVFTERTTRNVAGENKNYGLQPVVVGKNGTVFPVPDGKYKFLVRMLKLLHDDWSDDSSYESYLSRSFSIQSA